MRTQMLIAFILFYACASTLRAAEEKPGPRRILCFGDSNTVGHPMTPDKAWPAQAQSMLKGVELINAGVSGRTIGQEKDQLNGLESIDAALKRAGHVDEVIVMLGTNDTKGYNWNAGGGAAGVARRLNRLIDKVMLHQDEEGNPPQLTIVAPP